MADTTSRALALLNLLQVHRHWPGSELAERLGVTERTVRRDIERLRELGYSIESAPGVAGGYRLLAGTSMPPLLLSDEEAIAMAVGLRLAATQRLVGGAETTLTALAKLEQVLPRALRGQVAALAATVRPMGVERGTGAPPEVLSELALSCRDHERLRFGYTSAAGEVTERHVEPHYLMPSDRHWYLVCWDLDRDDWRTLRIDRMAQVRNTRWRFSPRPLTPDEAENLLEAASIRGRPRMEGSAELELPLEQVQQAFGPWAQGATAVDRDRTHWPFGATDVHEALYALSWIPAGVSYTATLPEPELGQAREILPRLQSAFSPGSSPARSATGDAG